MTQLDSESVEAVNAAALAAMQAQFNALMQATTSVTQSLLATRPATEVKLARIEAGVQTMQAVFGLLALFNVVMNAAKSGSDVEDVSELLDKDLNKLEETLKAYVERKRASEDLLVAAMPMRERLVLRLNEQAANRQLDAVVDAFKEAQAKAVEIGGEVGEILPGAGSIRVRAKNNFDLPALTDAPKVLS